MWCVLDLVDNFDCYYCIRSLNNFQYLNRFTFLFVRPTVVVLFGFPNIMLIILFIPNVVELIFVIISFAKKYPWSGSAVRQGAGPPVPTSTTWVGALSYLLLLYNFHWCAHFQSLVWPDIIICVHSLFNTFFHLVKSLLPAVKEPSVLNSIVHPLGQCIMQRITTLCHAYAYMLCF